MRKQYTSMDKKMKIKRLIAVLFAILFSISFAWMAGFDLWPIKRGVGAALWYYFTIIISVIIYFIPSKWPWEV